MQIEIRLPRRLDILLRPQQVYTEEFWRELSKRYGLDEIPKNRCLDWTRAARTSLAIEGVKDDVFSFRGVQNDLTEWLWTTHHVWGHSWLVSKTNCGLYVADGTAGQFQGAPTNGYFGYLNNAPAVLSQIYTYVK